MNPLKFSGGILVIILGTIMIAEGILGSLTNTHIFFVGSGFPSNFAVTT